MPNRIIAPVHMVHGDKVLRRKARLQPPPKRLVTRSKSVTYVYMLMIQNGNPVSNLIAWEEKMLSSQLTCSPCKRSPVAGRSPRGSPSGVE